MKKLAQKMQAFLISGYFIPASFEMQEKKQTHKYSIYVVDSRNISMM